MTNTYRIRYKDKDGIAVITDVDAASPISALNQIHRTLQLTKQMFPDEYKITGLALFYNANASGQPLMVESPYDIPDSANPVIFTPPEPGWDTPTMDFFPETENSGRLAE